MYFIGMLLVKNALLIYLLRYLLVSIDGLAFTQLMFKVRLLFSRKIKW